MTEYLTRHGVGYHTFPDRLAQWQALAAATECDACGLVLGDDRAALAFPSPAVFAPSVPTVYGISLHRGNCLALMLDRIATSDAEVGP